MAIDIAKLKKGEMSILGEVDERLPIIRDGLVAHFPFDSTDERYYPTTIRYIRDWANGSTINAYNHWVEIQAIDYDGNNVALGKNATNSKLTDGNTDTFVYYGTDLNTQYVQVSLGELYSIEKIKIWHYYSDGRTYHNTKTQVSQDGINWFTIFDSAIEGEYAETSEGKTHDLFNLGATVKPTTNTNTTLGFDDVAVEEGTTNLITNGNFDLDFESWGIWNSYGNTLTPEIISGARFNKILRLKNDCGTASSEQSIYNISPNTTYTLSYWVRIIRRASNYNCIYYQYNDGSGGSGYYYANQTIDFTKIGEWQYVQHTFTTPEIGVDYFDGDIVFRARIHDGEGDYRYSCVDFANIQVEEKAFATSFVDGSREGSQFQLPISSWGQEGTIYMEVASSYDLKSEATGVGDRGFFRTSDGTGSLLLYLNDGNQLNCVWGAGGATGTNNLTWKAREFHRIAYTFSKSGNIKKIYLDGKLDGTNTTWGNDYQWDYIKLSTREGGTYIGDFTIKNLSLYNRALSDLEIKQLSNPSFGLTKEGNVFTSKLEEKPHGLPNDAIYFSLGIDGKSDNELVVPVEDTSVFDEKGVWLGEGTTNLVPNADHSLVDSETYTTSWDNSLHPNALDISKWYTGYNSGVEYPEYGYHAHWTREGRNGDICVKFIDRNNEITGIVDTNGDPVNLGHRWLGVNCDHFNNDATLESLGIGVGAKLTISWWQKSDVLNKGAKVPIRYYSIANARWQFSSTNTYISVSQVGKWERVSYVETVTEDWDLTKSIFLYIYGNSGDYGTLWVEKPQVEIKPFLTPFTNETRPYNRINYTGTDLTPNNWQEFTIIYSTKYGQQDKWRLSGAWSRFYFGIGSNNKVCFSWTENGSQRGAIYGSEEVPINEWVAIACSIKNNEFIDLYQSGERVLNWTSPFQLNSTYMDFALNGIDHADTSYPLNAYIKDFIVIPRALTPTEIESIYKNQMLSYKDKLQVQGKIIENTTI